MRQLLGKSIADRYVDFCRVASGAIPLRVSVPVAGHAVRELDSVLQQTLAGPMGVALEATAEDKARLKAARKQLRALGFKDDAVNRAVEKLQPQRGPSNPQLNTPTGKPPSVLSETEHLGEKSAPSTQSRRSPLSPSPPRGGVQETLRSVRTS